MLKQSSPLRIFAFSTIGTIAIVLGVWWGFGTAALTTIGILLVIEIIFSIENAVINAKILTTLNRFWQTIFLTIGVLIAIFGMRLIFPIVIVTASTDLSWQKVIDLAINNPTEYSAALTAAQPSIAAFGGAFLLMLATSFFFRKDQHTLWLKFIEKPIERFSSRWLPAVITAGAVGIVGLASHNTKTVLTAGAVGIVTYLAVHGLAEFFSQLQPSGKQRHLKRVGMAAFMTFIYLELLDASFSLDSVIGAFVITNQVILITAGLAAGALWVRSITIYLVRHNILNKYKYTEHGAYYTVLLLAIVILLSELIHIPQILVGSIGIIFITSAIISSRWQKHGKTK